MRVLVALLLQFAMCRVSLSSNILLRGMNDPLVAVLVRRVGVGCCRLPLRRLPDRLSIVWRSLLVSIVVVLDESMAMRLGVLIAHAVC